MIINTIKFIIPYKFFNPNLNDRQNQFNILQSSFFFIF